MLVIIGHGPSIVGKRLGAWIDQQTVIRLKGAPKPVPEDWGTRTDIISTTKTLYVTKRQEGVKYWMFGDKVKGYISPDVAWWREWFNQFLTTPKRRKPSNGMCALMTAAELLRPAEVGLIGFDSILRPEVTRTGKWNDDNPGKWGHDQLAEHNAMQKLGFKVIDICSQPPNT